MRIVPLVEHPEHLDVVARWLWDEWHGQYDEQTFEQIRAAIAGRPSCPPTMLALESEPLGVIGFRRVKFRGREPLLLFINSLFVRPTHRRRGIASELLTEALSRIMPGDEAVFVYTQLREWYAARGFDVVEEESETGNVVLRRACWAVSNREHR